MSENILQQGNHFNDEISLKEIIFKIKNLFNYAFSQWKILLIAVLIGGLLGFAYSYNQKVIYTATLSFALEDESKSGGSGGALSLASSLGFELSGGGGGAFTGSNLTELMKSRRLIEQTLLTPVILNGEEISLVEMYIRAIGLRDKWGSNSVLNNELQFLPKEDRKKYSLKKDSVLGIIYGQLINNSISVDQKDKKISIISIDIKSENEFFAKKFAEALAKEVSDFYIETKSKKAKINLNVLQVQVDSIRYELNNAITGVALANDNTYNLNPAFNVKKAISTKRQVDVQANTAILTELVKNLEAAKVSLRKETPLIQIIDHPILPLKKDKVSNLRVTVIGGVLVAFFVLFFLFVKRWFKTMVAS